MWVKEEGRWVAGRKERGREAGGWRRGEPPGAASNLAFMRADDQAGVEAVTGCAAGAGLFAGTAPCRAGASCKAAGHHATGRPGRTWRPSRHDRSGAEAGTCLAVPRHGVVERLRAVLSTKMSLGFAPVGAAHSAVAWRSATAGGPTPPNISTDKYFMNI